jgi:hypothetical protein
MFIVILLGPDGGHHTRHDRFLLRPAFSDDTGKVLFNFLMRLWCFPAAISLGDKEEARSLYS